MTIEAIREARRSAKIATMDELSLRAATQEIMRETAMMNGKDFTIVEQFSSLMTRKLRTEFGGLTIDEVQLAFHAGTEEEFGKNYAITYATLLIWLRSYVSDRRVALVYEDERRKALKERRSSEPVMTEEQKAERIRRGNVEVITHRWQDIVAGRDSFEVPRAGALAFDYLVGLGKINPDAARRKRAEAQAAVDVPHPFVAALDNAKADEFREAVVKNNELDIYLRDLYNSGGELSSIGIYNDMPNYL